MGSTFSPVSSLLEYDPETDQWTARASLHRARGALAAAAIGDKIYARGKLFVIGGRVQGSGNLATLEVFDSEAGEWETRTPIPTARSGLATASHGGLLLVLGGEIPGVFEQNEVYDPATDSWFELTPMPVPPAWNRGRCGWKPDHHSGRSPIAGFFDTDVADELLILDQLAVMAQFAEGPGVGSEVTATNFTERKVTARLELYDNQGNTLESGLNGPGGPDASGRTGWLRRLRAGRALSIGTRYLVSLTQS